MSAWDSSLSDVRSESTEKCSGVFKKVCSFRVLQWHYLHIQFAIIVCHLCECDDAESTHILALAQPQIGVEHDGKRAQHRTNELSGLVSPDFVALALHGTDDTHFSTRRTSDGHALAVGWHSGWALWSTNGRLGSWSVAGSLDSGYGIEGERSDAFEDHFMQGVKGLVSLDSEGWYTEDH